MGFLYERDTTDFALPKSEADMNYLAKFCASDFFKGTQKIESVRKVGHEIFN